MFPLMHTLVAQILLETSHPRVILGAIFPDLGNAIGVGRDITHEMGKDFYQFCRLADPAFMDFAQAVIIHGSNPPGLDYYSDQKYEGQNKGYCFQRGTSFVDKVIKACGIPQDMGLWKAHNFIEMAFDVLAAEKNPHLAKVIMNALRDHSAIRSCSQLLARYFQIESSLIESTFCSMPQFFCLTQVTPDHLAEKYAIQLKNRHKIDTANPAAISQVIREAVKTVEREFNPFLNKATDLISLLLEEYPLLKEN